MSSSNCSFLTIVVRAAITKYLILGCLNHKTIFLHFWKLKVQEQGVGEFGFCPLLVDDHFLSVSVRVFFPSVLVWPWYLHVCPYFLL